MAFRLFCNLHTNERPFRTLMEELAGLTTHLGGLSAKIGKLLKKVEDFPLETNFKKINRGKIIQNCPKTLSVISAWIRNTPISSGKP